MKEEEVKEGDKGKGNRNNGVKSIASICVINRQKDE